MAGPAEGQRKFGYLTGSDAHDKVVLAKGEPLGNVGSTNLYRLRQREPDGYTRIHITRNFFRQGVRYRLEDFDCLLNLVTDPDQNPRVLENLVKLLRGFRGDVINHPAQVLRSSRDAMARRLAGVPGLLVPPIVRLRPGKPEVMLDRIEKAGVTFPAIVRAVGTHTGRIVGLFERARDIPPALAGAPEHFVISFVDFRSPDGLYRKYRVFFIGGRILLRHLLVGPKWNVHAADRAGFMAQHQEAIEEERRLFETGLPPRVTETLAAVRDRVGLDFFGIDFALDRDDTVILFEANATMNFFPFSRDPRFDYVKACLEPSRRAFEALLYPDDQLGDGTPGRRFSDPSPEAP